MKKFLAAALLFFVSPAQAQSVVRAQAQAIATCGGQSLTAGVFYPVTQDLTGTLCTASGGGGSTAVTIADGADVGEGATTAAAATAGSTGSVNAKLRLMTTQLATINTTLGSPFQAGGALAANQSVNVAQMNGVTTTMGNGVAGTGVQRVAIASDNTAFSVNAATQGAVNITLTDCSGTITSGGTAQNAFTAAATRHGFTIANIDTSEVLWISFTTTAAASGTGSYPIPAADATTFANLASFTSPPGMGINTALSVIAATTSHKYSCTVW